MNEEELRKQIFNETLLFLNKYPFCKCLNRIRNGDKLLLDYEIETIKLKENRKRLRKIKGGVYKPVAERIGKSANQIRWHHWKHGRKQVVAVNEFVNRILELAKQYSQQNIPDRINL
jgi:hypothetical protein